MSDTTPHFCTACGAQLVDGAHFCAACGAPVVRTPAATAPPEVSAPPPAPGIDPAPASNTRIVLILAAGVVALLLIIAIIGFAVTRKNSETTGTVGVATASSKSPASNGMTQVTVRVAGCDDCTIKAVWAGFPPAATPDDIWNSGDLPVVNSAVSFPVPVAKSQGLSFEVSSPRDRKDAVTVAVVRYANAPAGTTVTAEQAAASTEAFGCWAGSTFAEETLDLQVDWFTGTDIEGKPGQMLRAYFNPGLATYGTATTTTNGDLGHQNVWSCTPVN